MGVRNLLRKALTAFLVLAGTLPGQDTGRLSGSVVDPTGSSVPSAKIQVRLRGGDSPVLSAHATGAGLFSFTGVRPGLYDLSVEAPGFQSVTVRNVKIEPGRETALPPLQLELGAVTQLVEVSATPPGVQTANAEISTTVTNEQVRRLPLFDRSPLMLIHTQAGVTTGRGPTVINGLRTSFANATLDGINIQDNAVRSNALNYLPNLLLMDQVAEMTILTSNAQATFGGGASQLVFVTPSGANQFHGSLYWFNRNSVAAANGWFNNKDGISRPFLNQNQAGGSLGGRLIRDKLFFYTNYEALRLKQQATVNRVLPTEEARRGIFTYRTAQGQVRKENVLQLGGVPMDPFIRQLLDRVPGPERINNFRAGDSSESLLRNTAGYTFLIRDNRTRDNYTAKLDYIHSTRHTFAGTLAWNRDIVDRPDASNDFSAVPKVTNDDARTLLSVAWRWSPSPRLTNELRGGFNLAPASFRTSEKFGSFLLDGLFFSNPVNLTQPESRQTDTFNYQDNLSYVFGRHRLQFGFQAQQIRLETRIDDGIIPTYVLGIGTGNPGLFAQQLPGIGAADFARANSMLATLAGYVTAYDQSFNVTSRTSGFVSGAPRLRDYTLDNFAFYFQDTWKIRPRLALNLGVRYDYWSPLDESRALALIPIVQNDNPIGTLLSNVTFDFAGNAVRRRWYNRDLNNFAPNIGLAWDLFGNGRTAVRAGYSLSFVNDEMFVSLDNSVNTNQGLSTNITATGLSGRISSGLPRIPTPQFKIPRTALDNNRENPFSAIGMPDPGLRVPYVQQWTLGVQQDWRGNVFELRYVGNHATKQFRAFDYNQVLIRENGFLDDFRRAQNNGNLAQAARGIYDPRYNPQIPGSQPLTVFPRLIAEGLLTNPIIISFIQTGQPGELAAIYQTNRLNGSVDFFRNPFSLGTNMMTNYSNSTYHALQFDVRRRAARDLFFQANYSYSKVLSDTAGQSQFRFEPFLDLASPSVERARAPFDLTHVLKGNWIYDLPVGPGHRLHFRPLRHLLGGWSIGGLVTIHSGTPFSVISGRGTVNRGGRSFNNTANTTLAKDGLDGLFQVRMTGDGPFFVAASAIAPDGRAVVDDGRQPFSGQVFFHPEAGTLGTLQRRMFSGPWVFDMDARLMKTTRIGERHTVEFYLDAFSTLNNPTWFVGDHALESVNFGRIASNFTAPRQLQFGLYYRF